jgi:hypothetical protein
MDLVTVRVDVDLTLLERFARIIAAMETMNSQTRIVRVGPASYRRRPAVVIISAKAALVEIAVPTIATALGPLAVQTVPALSTRVQQLTLTTTHQL